MALDQVYLHAYETVSAAREGIGSYINFYNTRRPHSSHQARTPDVVYFASINVAESTDKVQAFARDLGLSFPLLLDATGSAKSAYGAGPGSPVTLLIDAKGIVRVRFDAATSGGALKGRLLGLL